MFDVVIVGGGAAAAAAALGLSGLRVLVLDAGGSSSLASPQPGLAFYEMRRWSPDLFGYLVGDNCEGLVNAYGGSTSPKLKSPGMSFVTADWRKHLQIKSQDFSPEISLAKGGFANAWGAGCFRYTPAELVDFPLAAGALDQYYDRLTSEMGVSGTKDDLRPFFGTTRGLQPPMELHPWAASFLSRYSRRKKRLQSRGYFVGRPRLAVLTESLGARSAYDYGTLDFFQPCQPSIYTPAFTIDRLVAEDRITYVPGQFVEGVREQESAVEILARPIGGGESICFRARKCILAAGAIGSAHLALRSFGRPGESVPLRENPTSLMVLFDPSRLGRAQRIRSFGGCQLSLLYQQPGSQECLLGSLYDLGAVLRSDVLFDLPLPVGSFMALSRSLLSAFLVLQIFYPDAQPRPGGRISLTAEGGLDISYRSGHTGELERRIMRDFLPLGYFTMPPMWKRPPAGQCFHYAGTLPMCEQPSQLECWPDGRLACSRNVYVADAANFPRLPSKNLTFTAMANAWRIAEGLREQCI